MKSRLRWLPYSLIGALAIGGQFLAGVEHLDPEEGYEYAAIVAVAVGVEAMAVWLSVLARERARLGENARLHWVISCLFASVAVVINFIGHGGDPYASVVFGGFSLAGFVIFVSEQASLVRNAWDADGKIRAKVPAHAHLAQFESDPRVIDRARRIAQIWAEENPDAEKGLGPVTALELAREQLATEERRTSIQRVTRTMFAAQGATADQVRLALLAYDTEGVAAALMQNADNTGLAIALGSGITPDRLTDVSRSALDRLTGGSPRREPAQPGGSRRLAQLTGSPAHGGSTGEPGSSTTDEPPGSPAQDGPAHHEPTEPQMAHTAWFDRAAQAWIVAVREGRSPLNHELAQAGGVSLATLKRHKTAIYQIVITMTAVDTEDR